MVVADTAMLSKYAHLCEVPVRPARWLTESVRDHRLKSPDLYRFCTPSAETCLRAPPSSSKRRYNYSEFRVEVNYDLKSQSAKRRKVVDYSLSSGSTASDQSDSIVKNLFPVLKISRPPSTVRHSEAVETVSSPSARPRRWACEIRPTMSDTDFPMNAKICELLGVVQEAYALKKDHFRTLGYQRAIAKIRSLPHEVLTIDDVRSLGGETSIGSRIERKITEIITTGRLLQAETVLNNSENVAVKTLCDVWGIGPVKAMGLVAEGITSIEQLRAAVRKNDSLLDLNQKIGLKHYEDLLHRIPREQVAELEYYVRRIVKRVDSSIDIKVAGSYLRGKKSCGDVDILVYGSSQKLKKAFPEITKRMKKDGVLTDDLVHGAGKYFGIFKFPGRRHGRIDLFAVPHEQYPYALLTYTGSAVFNSHQGLQKVCRTNYSRTRVEPPIRVRDEKEIFLLLDIPYVPPSARSIS
ncbi:DNA polymerase lambda [Gracilariopsis chorda]|uniref:DNA polymerase n=1 Tax=Gracilariopsis chorda TaxID=448386 RepID=A0A2V3IIZ9_9FLOR|nr:DNA polymerase lambda [Gracilariopsis chorda]|eukprot:PXF42057.1 DNA polymerase lambda [Gracilariopsis chorda]